MQLGRFALAGERRIAWAQASPDEGRNLHRALRRNRVKSGVIRQLATAYKASHSQAYSQAYSHA